jgi:hypothetical protein
MPVESVQKWANSLSLNKHKWSLIMKNQLPIIILIFLFTIAITDAKNTVSKVGTTVAPFLNVDIGSRGVGMGGAFVAISDDATSMFWNPAGIARMSYREVIFGYNKWFADINLNYVAFALPMGSRYGAVGISTVFLNYGDMEKTTYLNPEGTGEIFSAASYAIALNYARNLTDRFQLGLNVKFINERIYHSSASGFAFDIGTLYTSALHGLTIGMSIRNYGTKMRMDGRDLFVPVDVDPTIEGNNYEINGKLYTEAYDLPLLFRVGLAMDVLKGIGNSNLILAFDALHPNDDYESVNVGAEYIFNKMFLLRAGYKSLFIPESEEGLCFGAGLQTMITGMLGLKFDYAYQTFGILGNTQMINASFTF